MIMEDDLLFRVLFTLPMLFEFMCVRYHYTGTWLKIVVLGFIFKKIELYLFIELYIQIENMPMKYYGGIRSLLNTVLL